MVEESVSDLLVTVSPNFWDKPEIRLRLEAHLEMEAMGESQAMLRHRRQCARETLEALLQMPS